MTSKLHRRHWLYCDDGNHVNVVLCGVNPQRIRHWQWLHTPEPTRGYVDCLECRKLYPLYVLEQLDI